MRRALRWLPLPFLVFAFWKLKPWQADFSNVAAWPLVLGLVINFCCYLPVRTFRWRTTLVNPPKFMRLYWAQIEGSAVGGAVGFGAQDVVRAARIRPDMSRFSKDFGATLAERFAEAQALTLLMAAAACAGLMPLWGLLPAMGTAVGLFVTAKAGPRIADKLSRWPKIAQGVSAVSASIRTLTVLKVVALSLVGWGIETFILVLSFMAFSLPAVFSNALLVVIGINVAITLPGLPASVGTFEAGVAGVLSWRGIPPDQALAFAIAYHIIMAVPVYLTGGALVLLRAAGQRA